MNRGVRAGIAQSEWRTYTPILEGFAYVGHGTPTQPAIVNGTSIGRYWRTPNGLVMVQGQVTFGSSDTFGSGEDFWGVSLPFPANRSSGGADLPAGAGMAWQGSAASPSLMTPLVVTLLDPAFPDGVQSQEDIWLQLFCQWAIARGTGTITSGGTSTTISHGLPLTPNAEEIHITPTNSTTNAVGLIYVDTITSTQFTVHCRANPGASNLTFSWKIRAEPEGPNSSTSAGGTLLGAKCPWTFASGHQIGWQAIYEARR